MNRKLNSKKAFTLLELIVVIIIIGILATLGFTQYNNVLERSRISEATVAIGLIRKLTTTYYFNNGTLTTMTNNDVGVGSSSGQIPSSCTGTHYFSYIVDWTNDTNAHICAWRCTSGGKNPQYSVSYELWMDYNANTGGYVWQCGPNCQTWMKPGSQ